MSRRRRQRSQAGHPAPPSFFPNVALTYPSGYIVPAPSANATTDAARHALRREIEAWVTARVAPHKRLRGGVVLVDAIPKSPSGKILRKDLRARAAQEFEGEVAEAKL